MIDLAEMLIGAVAEAVISIVAGDLAQRPGLAGIREKLQGDSPEKLALQRAITRALATFAETYPGIADSLFDEYFLNKPEVHQELAKLLTPNLSPNHEAIAKHWQAQLPKTGKQYNLTAAVNDFIQALNIEIKAQPKLKPFVDTRIFDQILERQDNQVALQTEMRDTLNEMRDLIKQRAFWKADAEQEVLPRPGATSAILAQDPDDLTEKPRKLFGRDDLLRDVRALLDAGERVLLQGFGGMGKTALAATIVAQWIRDGKGAALWLKTGSAPTDALMEALARPLNAAQIIARETGDAKTQTMRAILRKSGVKLLVLDDCWNGAALFALLKAVPSEMPVLLTARQRYSIEGKIRDVGELSRADSLRLLAYHADLQLPVASLQPPTTGNSKSETSASADALCNTLGDHAFAIEIAGKVLKAQKWMPEKLLNDISTAPHNLTLPLEFAEPGRENVAKLLETSLNALDDETRAVFRAFGAFFAPALTAEMLMRYFLGKPEISDEMLADVRKQNPHLPSDMPDDQVRLLVQDFLSQNIDPEPVEEALTTLELHGLVESIPAADNAQAHYRLHDLAYSYASAQNTEVDHHRALDACLVYVKCYAKPTLANFAALRPELDNLLKAADWAFQIGRYVDVRTFPEHLYAGDGSGGFLPRQGFSSLALDLLSQAAEAAARQGNKQAQGVHLSNLGTAYRALGQTDRAIQYFEQALVIAREIGDKRAEGAVLGNLGTAYRDLGQTDRAIQYFEQALVIAREIGDKRGEGSRLGNLGLAYSDLGQTDRAIQYFEQVLKINREMGDKQNEGNTLGNLGNIYRDLGQTDRAIQYHEQALTISREIGAKRNEGNTLGNLGNIYRDLGKTEHAMDYYQQSSVIHQAIGDRMGEANNLTNIGILYADRGDYPQAIIYYEQARPIYIAIGAVHLVAKVDQNLALVREKMAGATDSPEP